MICRHRTLPRSAAPPSRAAAAAAIAAIATASARRRATAIPRATAAAPMAASPALPPVTLRYFALPSGLSGRGGAVRFLLLACGVPVTEDTVDFGQWGAGEAAGRARWRALGTSPPPAASARRRRRRCPRRRCRRRRLRRRRPCRPCRRRAC